MGFKGTCCISYLHQICIILIYECDAKKNHTLLSLYTYKYLYISMKCDHSHLESEF